MAPEPGWPAVFARLEQGAPAREARFRLHATAEALQHSRRRGEDHRRSQRGPRRTVGGFIDGFPGALRRLARAIGLAADDSGRIGDELFAERVAASAARDASRAASAATCAAFFAASATA
jgi:hypothetical protein